MSDSVLKDLLKEYEIKRLHAEQLADEKRDQLFKKYPEFEEINSEIAKCGLNLSREKLQAHDNQKIDVLKQELELLKEKKHNFLKSIKMSEDDLLPKYECSICNDTGYIAENNSFTMCSCLKQKLINISYNKSNINKLDFENFSNFDINMYSDEVDTGIKCANKGYTLLSTKLVKSWHQHIFPSDRNQRSCSASYFMSRNPIYLARKYYGVSVIFGAFWSRFKLSLIELMSCVHHLKGRESFVCSLYSFKGCFAGLFMKM